jgi:propanediol dehydratase-reactivating factor small subunit
MSSNSLLLQVTQKPAVVIGYVGDVSDVSDEMVKALQEGLEEEGIPCEVHCFSTAEVSGHGPRKSVAQIASELAKTSRINVGLVVIGHENIALLHHRDLPVDLPLMRLDGLSITVDSLRILGRNAARLVKGDPFILV